MQEPDRRFNVSRWALEHPALTRYLMIVLMVLGFAAYFQLGQDEDPPFTYQAERARPLQAVLRRVRPALRHQGLQALGQAGQDALGAMHGRYRIHSKSGPPQDT